MARLSILSERVRSLVDGKLVPLYLAETNTAGLTKTLNRSLAKGQKDGTIHPNRLHALLSDDVSRGANEATLALVEEAVAAFETTDPQWATRSEQRLAQLQAETKFLRESAGLADAEIQRRLGIPPAVARAVFAYTPLARSIPAQVSAALDRRKKTKAPDWSFQDVAIRNTLDAFQRKPTSKIGLILPTGAGKTRTALQIILERLVAATDTDAPVYWVTHRKNLRTQAHRQLQRLLSDERARIPANAASLLATRIKFVMVSELPRLLAADAVPPLLVVVDEAHHAAAPSYQPIFDASYSVSSLFLTATPNRADGLPIGIDEISFTITYRDLEERGVIVMPEYDDFPVEDFEWSEKQVRDLADYIIDRSSEEFTKTLVLAPRIDRVEEFYEVLVNAIAEEKVHPLDARDIGFIHGTRNSLGIDNDDFLDLFTEKPRAILVSAQLLLEGFDDPGINAIVITYPSQSIIRLMQAAGRCVRYAPEKRAAYVVQARNDELAYYFDQRWLYQEISDYLRPQLIDIDYASERELEQKIMVLLAEHNVDATAQDRIRQHLASVKPGDTCRVLLYGYPYYDKPERFDQRAKWGASLETPLNSATFRDIFNGFCTLGATLSDPSDFLARYGSRLGIAKELSAGSPWREYMQILTASYFAREEIYGSDPIAKASRPSKRHGPTTWLRYVAFHFRPSVPPELSDFLADCYNSDAIVAKYLDNTTAYALAIKLPLPLGGHEAWLLTPDETALFESCIGAVRDKLRQITPADQFAALASFLISADYRWLPSRVFLRIESFLTIEAYGSRVLRFPSYENKGETK